MHLPKPKLKILVGSLIFVSLWSTAVTFATTYVAPGFTLDPAGGPGSYTVTPPISYGNSVTTGHNNEILYNDGSGNLASNSNFFFDSTNNRLGIGTSSPDAFIDSVGITEQLRLGYDDLNYFSTTVASNGATTFSITGTGIMPLQNFTFSSPVVMSAAASLTLGSSGSSTGLMAFKNSSNSNNVSIRSGVTSATYILTLPVDDGTSNQVLTTDGSGVLSWTTPSGGSGTPAGSNTQVQYNNSGAFGATSSFAFDSSTTTLTSYNPSNGDGKVRTGILNLTVGAGSKNVNITPSGSQLADYTLTLPVDDGTSNQVLTTDGSGVLSWTTPTSSGWNLTGNAGAYPGTNFIGTTDDLDFMMKRNNIAAGLLSDFTTSFGVGATPNATGYNSAFGVNALANDLAGNYNVAMGYSALTTNVNGSYNVAIGNDTLFNNTNNYNTAIGYQAGYSNTTGSSNIFIGQMAGSNQTTVNEQVGIGYEALKGSGVVSGTGNVALGFQAGLLNSTGSDNSFIGYGSGSANTTGSENTFTGMWSGLSNTTASNNTFYGRSSGHNNTTGSSNTYIGRDTGYNQQTTNAQVAIGFGALAGSLTLGDNTGSSNIAIGYETLFSNTSGAENIANGFSALYSNTEGGYNVASGSRALYTNTTGSFNVASGYKALYSNTIGYDNTANGANALYSNTEGATNVANGYRSLFLNTTGSGNVFTGYQAGYNQIGVSNQVGIGYEALRGSLVLVSNTGEQNTAVGYQTLRSNSTGYNNTAVGYQALNSNTTGYYNTALGSGALQFNTTGAQNIATGTGALLNNSTGSNNIATGLSALNTNSTGSNNTAVGLQALYSNTTGSSNVAVGDASGENSATGSSNIFIGSNSGVNVDGWSDSIAIGRLSRITASNQMVIGVSTHAIESTIWNGAASTCTLTTGTGLACSSDERLKTNIVDFPGDTLSKLMNVRTVRYNWLQNPSSRTQIGFLAQNLELEFPELIDTNSDGIKSVYYSQMTPVLVEAVKELNLKLKSFDDLMIDSNSFAEILRSWLANASNNITRIFTGEICLTEAGQNSECINRSQLQQLKQLLNSQNQSNGNSPTPQPEPTPDPTPLVCTPPQTLNTEGTLCIDPVLEPTPDPTPIPDPVPEPVPVPDEIPPPTE